MLGKATILGLILVWTMGCLGCSDATRALVKKDDMGKVFPWPRKEERITIRVMPLSTAAATCSLFGSYREVEVDPDTTFYIVDDLDKKFSYTPNLSPIRRLASVRSVEIRWPMAAPVSAPETPSAPGAAPAPVAPAPTDGSTPPADPKAQGPGAPLSPAAPVSPPPKK